MKTQDIDFIESIASSIDGHARRVVHTLVPEDRKIPDMVWIKSLKDQKIIAIEIPDAELTNAEFIRQEIKRKLSSKEE